MSRAGHVLGIKNDGVHVAGRKGMGEPLEQVDIGFLIPTLLCEELRMFHFLQSQTTGR